MKFNKILPFILSFLLLAVFPNTGKTQAIDSKESAGPMVQKITIAVSTDTVPFHFSDDQGQPSGILVDMWRLWSKKTGAEIRQALDASDLGQAHSLVHSLKGVAGNLSAGGLQAATVELEKLVKHADKNEAPPPDALNSRLAVLEKALDQALEAARTLKPLIAEVAEPVAVRLRRYPWKWLKQRPGVCVQQPRWGM